MHTLSETILQFGSGKFLRGFADLFIHQANLEGQNVGRIVVAQSTGDSRANLINDQKGKYHVVVRGLSGGVIVDRVEESASLSRGLIAASQWPQLLEVARAPQLRYILSNTAENGYDLHSDDRSDSAPPRSFPGKLLLLLRERFQAGHPGVTLLPCELFEHNGEVLRGILLKLAKEWNLSKGFTDWLERECTWLSSLVDRIVVGPPADHPMLQGDQLAVMAEPFALWAIEMKPSVKLFRHPAIQTTEDVRPFFLRKVRILNGAHTALVGKAMPRGYTTVRQAVQDPAIDSWLNRLLFEEIVPTLEGRVESPAEFARQTLERFRNPFLEHKLTDIAAYHSAKVKIRLGTSCAEFQEKFGQRPALLEEAIAAKVGV